MSELDWKQNGITTEKREELEKVKKAEFLRSVARKKLRDKIESIGIPEDQLKVTVEIGARGDPAFILQERPLEPNELYICIDSSEFGPHSIELDQIMSESEEGEKNYLNIDANATNMSFLKDNSVNEVVMTNVLGDPVNNYDSDILRQLILESIRILKKDGKAIFTETLTPDRNSVKGTFEGIFNINTEFKTQFGSFITEAVNQDKESAILYDRNLHHAEEIRKSGHYIPFTSTAPLFQLILKKI